MTLWDNFKHQVYKDFKEKGYRGAAFRKAFTSENIKALWKETPKDDRLELVKDPKFGNIVKHEGYSQPTLRALMYIREMEKYFDLNQIKHLTDFGAGYGNFIRVFDQIFHASTYTSIDFPEIHEIQKEYLDHCNIEVEFRTSDEDMSPLASPALFLASHSLNECPMEVRDQVEEILSRYEYIYIVYNKEFDDIDNKVYFEELRQRLSSDYLTHINFNKVTAKWSLIAVKQ